MAKKEIIAGVKGFLRNSGREISTRVTFPWLTNQVPVMGDPAIPAAVIRTLSDLHRDLGGDWLGRLRKGSAFLTYDMQVGDSTLIEIDLVHRFSTARRKTLRIYHGVLHNLDLALYRRLCDEHSELADRQAGQKQTPGFPFPGGRAAQAALRLRQGRCRPAARLYRDSTGSAYR